MPRPKRPKMVHTVPILGGARSAATSSTQKRLRNTSPASASSGRVTNTTDDSDGLVTTQVTAARPRTTKAQEDFIMTGALGEEETGGTRLRPLSTRTVEEVNRIAREAEYVTIAAKRRKAHEIAAANSSDQVHLPSTLHLKVGTRPPNRTGPSAIHSRQPSIVSRGQQTPLTHSSKLGVTMFKKRPRQPSLLQLVQSQNVQSEMDGDGEDLDDFYPDDESTPLVKSLSQSHVLSTSSSSPQTSRSRKRKLALPDIQIPASQSESMPSSPPAMVSQPLEQDITSAAEEESEALEPVLPEPHVSQTPPPEIFSDTLALPQSSSSSNSPPARTIRTTTRKASISPTCKSKTKNLHQPNEHLPAYSPKAATTTTSSPVRQPLKPLTTATLQNLLPRRRTRHRPLKGAYDFPNSSDAELDPINLDEDEDELSFHSASKFRRKTKTTARNMQQSTQKRGAKPKAAKRTSVAAAAAEKSQRPAKTYGRKVLADCDIGSGDEEENDSLGPVRFRRAGKGKGEGGLDGKAKREMERLARKFAEVDDYMLDFEDVTGSSSQMVDAR